MYIHCFKLLCWERGLNDVAVVSQCGVGIDLVRFSGDPVGSSLSCGASQAAGPAGHQRCS